ncbi:MAG: STAS domain-containing protein [Candidatus Riflebacteria bacterium]|nr:STAS domain-containing protein [Candidatus Riflebacteria bacterium]
MDSYQITSRIVDQIVVFSVRGYFSSDAGNEIYDALDGLHAKGIRVFVLDFADCQMFNSTGVAVLLDISGKVREEWHAELFFDGLNEICFQTLRMTGLMTNADRTLFRQKFPNLGKSAPPKPFKLRP